MIPRGELALVGAVSGLIILYFGLSGVCNQEMMIVWHSAGTHASGKVHVPLCVEHPCAWARSAPAQSASASTSPVLVCAQATKRYMYTLISREGAQIMPGDIFRFRMQVSASH